MVTFSIVFSSKDKTTKLPNSQPNHYCQKDIQNPRREKGRAWDKGDIKGCSD